VSVKKAKAKGKSTAKKAAEKTTPDTKKGKDILQVRENINDLVKNSAEDIAIEVIKVAMTGQLATAKYLFEAVGLYPATEETTVRPIETSLAHTLLTRMGLPLEPVICDEDAGPAVISAARVPAAKAMDAGEENPTGEGHEEQAPAQGE
jgi:hypothetical protein